MQFRRMMNGIFPQLFMFEGIEIINGKEESVVAVELDFKGDNISIEHVFRVPKFHGIKALPKVIEWLEQTYPNKNIVCLPLDKYRSYYRNLGFRVSHRCGEDIYFIKEKRQCTIGYM